MPAATSPFVPVAPQSDETRSTSCTEDEALHVPETPAKVRGVWKVAVVAAATGLIAAASTWWSQSLPVGDEITGLASTYFPYGTIGCMNWADIEISRSQVSDKNACATLCENTPGCTTFNWQATACEPGWPVENGCLLFKDTCTTVRNDCWELNYKIEQTVVAQTLTVETSAEQADAEAAVVAALANAGIQPVTVTVTPGRRLQPTPVRHMIIQWQWGMGNPGIWDAPLAYDYAMNLLRDPATSAAFIARCKDNLPQGSTFDVTEFSEPAAPVLPGHIHFNCTDEATSIGEVESAESCHEEKVRALSLETKDLPPEVKENEGAFFQFLLAHRRSYFHGYLVNATEFKARLETFSATMKLIEERNALASKSGLSNPARHGITKFADWTPAEFQTILGGRGPEEQGRLRRLRLGTEGGSGRETRSLEDAPGSAIANCTADWSARNEIRNQGACGNCWSFATAESIRSAAIQQTGQDPGPLSTQYLTDCVYKTMCSGSAHGCCGGNTAHALEWLEKVQKEGGGIPTREAYGDMLFNIGEEPAPHESSSSSSATGLSSTLSSSGGPVVNPCGQATGRSIRCNGRTYSGNFPQIPFRCKTRIKPAVKLVGGGPHNLLNTTAEMEKYVCGTGSLAIAVWAEVWKTYVGGVLDAKSCNVPTKNSTNHAVLLVGVNQEENAWLVQNSWGQEWGINQAGEAATRDKYLYCPHIAGKDRRGCAWPWGKTGQTVADVCPWSCAENPTKGGFIWLHFGEDTCNIHTEAIRIPTVEIV